MPNAQGEAQSAKVLDALAGLDARSIALKHRILNHSFQTADGYEMATYGLARRIGVLTRTMHNVFRIAPPGKREKPEREELEDLAINLQAHVFNTFGATENLGWIWLHETMGAHATKIPPTGIGIRKKNVKIVQTLPR